MEGEAKLNIHQGAYRWTIAAADKADVGWDCAGQSILATKYTWSYWASRGIENSRNRCRGWRCNNQKVWSST